MKQKSTLTLQEFLPYRLSVLTNSVSALIATSYSESFGIRIPEWRAIAVLGESPGITSSQIVQRTAMDKVSVSRTVQSLTTKKLIYKRSSATDRRVSHLRLTSKGRNVYEQIVPMALEFERKFLRALSSQEQVVLDRLIHKLQESVNGLRSL